MQVLLITFWNFLRRSTVAHLRLLEHQPRPTRWKTMKFAKNATAWTDHCTEFIRYGYVLCMPLTRQIERLSRPEALGLFRSWNGGWGSLAFKLLPGTPPEQLREAQEQAEQLREAQEQGKQPMWR